MTLPAVVFDPGRVEDRDQVDVGGIVELARAVLAHGEDDIAAVGERYPGKLRDQLAALRQGAQQVRQRGREGGVGEVAQALSHVFERPVSGQVGKRYGKGHLALGGPKLGHQPCPLRLGGQFRLEPDEHLA
jgi:hypothetical protein